MQKRVPTEEECWDKFWEIVAIAHVEACHREAAEAARRAGKQGPARSTAEPLGSAGTP